MMTRKEAIIIIERVIHTEAKWPGTEDTLEALDMALTALRPVSRERVEKAWKSKWVQLNNSQEHFCECCGVSFNLYSCCKNDYRFCPYCGSPMTDEAAEMVMERLEALKDGSTTD